MYSSSFSNPNAKTKHCVCVEFMGRGLKSQP